MRFFAFSALFFSLIIVSSAQVIINPNCVFGYALEPCCTQSSQVITLARASARASAESIASAYACSNAATGINIFAWFYELRQKFS